MSTPILVGVDGTSSGLDAVALAVRIARATGDPLVVACVYPDGESKGADAAMPERAAATLDRARELTGDLSAEFRGVPASSPARGLAEIAEAEDPRMVVVGSHRSGAIGRVTSGGTAERLLHGTACPVAVAPRGYRRRSADALRRIGAAFVDTPEGHQAVRVAADLASRARLPLTVLSVVAVRAAWWIPEEAVPEEERIPSEVRKEYEVALDKVVAVLPDDVDARGALLYGDVVDELSMVGERGIDLLVCGSRGYGPVRRVLLGTVSSALVRQASQPILVVPRASSE